MSATTTVLCDACGNDITDTGSMPAFRLVLASEPLPRKFGDDGYGVVFDVMVYQPIKRRKHFCGTDCLKYWACLPYAEQELSQVQRATGAERSERTIPSPKEKR